jgi:hypothetical protein
MVFHEYQRANGVCGPAESRRRGFKVTDRARDQSRLVKAGVVMDMAIHKYWLVNLQFGRQINIPLE